ncbi:ABC transporter ATP-binding protein [Echinicola rosea]|uniref:ABC transporter ATP-binding protein n=1 Tax=Echinicola rosea TaxID=1807691 RepID=A0ABQ1V5W4_9BACT|nr:ABC transporter ATP-binding protein [Echinicola rosea]GGF40046.1 ABC transporter ATP-binding protein [Echinicola rosea]
MLITQSVSFEYNKDNQFEFPDLNVPEGTDLLILGESGVGKTTFLHLIAGLLKPKNGSIQIGETDIAQLRGKQLDTFRGGHVGIVFQRAHFIQSLTLEENLEMVRFLANKPQDSHQIREVLDGLGLLDKLKSYPRQLSQGEQQRASIALAVINRPKLILADEPTAALDDKNCFRVIELLKRQTVKTNSSLIIITHDQRLKSEFPVSVTLPAIQSVSSIN